MKRQIFGVALAAAAFIANIAHAQSVSRPSQDGETCYTLYNACYQGVTSRGENPSTSCEPAYRSCLDTRVWQTQGRYGRLITNVPPR